MSQTLQLGHFGLRTRNLPAAIEWYAKALNTHVQFQNELAAFMSFDEEHHRFVLWDDGETGEKPVIVATSARRGQNRASFVALRDMLNKETRPFLILFGTGWGLTETILLQSDYVLEAVEGRGDYNHLSVRSAAAIILDRLLGRREKQE